MHMSHFAKVIVMLLLSGGAGLAQDKPQYDMGRMQMVFLRRAQGTFKAKQIREHREHVNGLVEKGELALAGSVEKADDLEEILVIKTDSPGDAKAIIDLLPAVQAGILHAETITWYAARNMIKPPSQPSKSKKYVFGLLVRGPAWTSEKTAATEKIQEGHMANINRLAQMGKLVLAGPFVAGGERSGVFIFKVKSLKEAQELTDTDPAVIAGRLRVRLYWLRVPEGALP